MPRHPPRPRPAASPRTERSAARRRRRASRAATLAPFLTRALHQSARRWHRRSSGRASGRCSAPPPSRAPRARCRRRRRRPLLAVLPSVGCVLRACARAQRTAASPPLPSVARSRAPHRTRAQATQATDRALRPAAWAPARCAPPPAAPAPAPAPKRPFRGVSRVERICDYVRPCQLPCGCACGCARSKWKIGAPPAGASAARCRSRRVACVRQHIAVAQVCV